MDMKSNTVSGTKSGLDLPLPGFYPCLTWQLNVTVHQPTGLAKYVSVIREPNDHIEVLRDFHDLDGFALVAGVVTSHTLDCIRALGYMSGLSKGV